MAQPHSQTQQRPGFPPQSQTYSHPYPAQPQNVRSQFSPQSPPHSLSYSSPSPQPQSQMSPTFSNQAPPAKRPRLSEDAPSPFSQTTGVTQASSPVNGQVNGNYQSGQPKPSLMPPPQQPVIKKEEVDATGDVPRNNSLAPTSGGSFSTPYSMSPSMPQISTTPNHMINNQANTVSRPNQTGPSQSEILPVISQEERNARLHERLDWEEARHAQHELWDSFLYGGTLNDKIKSIAHRSNLVEPQSGVLVNTQKNQPPPIVRVNGHEGATRVIKDGQSILDTREKAERLNELVKLLGLAAKARMTGFIETAARIANERRQHSQGRIPDDWTDIAVKPSLPENEPVSSPSASVALKRTHSQANSDTEASNKPKPQTHIAVSAFAKYQSREIKAERARQVKRRKRTEVVTAQEAEATVAAEQDALNAVAEDSKKSTKKERRIAESKLSEQQQHASTNEAARMATANIFGKFASNKKKNYSWLQPGGAATPVRSTSSTAAPTRSTSVAPTRDKGQEVKKGPQLGLFNDAAELDIQARDILLVLEGDGRAARSYVKGSSTLDEANAV